MDITCIGGGPAGLYFGILMRKALPDCRVVVHERNQADDTFGWGVVFSDETLDHIRLADPETFSAVERSFVHWTDIETHYRGRCVTSTGHGFSGLSRQRLLTILQERARELGVDLHFQSEVSDLDAVGPADLIVAADGVNSMVRQQLAHVLEPTLDWRRCKFSWLGTDKPLHAFTFIFKENDAGLFQVHAYPFQKGLSTWIVECHEDVWRKAGLADAGEADTVAYMETLFAEELAGHSLLTNRSLWRTFPTVRCKTWHHGNVVIVGDAAHTAHFSIGSGTKLAMEDAIALRDAFVGHRDASVPEVLEAYENARYVDVLKTQKAAQTSLEWFENSARYMGQSPYRFTFNLMTRSKRITFDNLRVRDPVLIDHVLEEWAGTERGGLASDGTHPPPIFTPFSLRGLSLRNRIVVSPMCQYSAKDGTVDDWHVVHLGSRAVGGAGLVITEMTNVTPEGRITEGCAGMYDEVHVAAWSRITDFVHRHTPARIGIQLAHAGRKGSTLHPWTGRDEPLRESGWTTLGPSALPFDADWPAPKAMDRSDMDAVKEAFVLATERAGRAGFDLVELHCAHGYLLSSFLSPAANQRRDAYGGSLENRMRYPLEVFDAVRAAWPKELPLSVRISATDWLPEGDPGMTEEDAIVVARNLKEHGCDLIDVSTGGNTPRSKPVLGRMYQVPFADRIRHEVGIPTMAVGAILGADHANTILAAGRADLICMARPHLRDPYITLHAAEDYAYPDQWWPPQYLAGRPSHA